MQLCKIKSIKKIKTVDTVYDITTKTHTLLCNKIYVHNCSGNSPEYIKKYGLRLPNVAHSTPAVHPQTLVNHMQCFASYLQGLFAGAIGWDAVNMFFAPLLVDMSYKEIKQVAQHLIFSFAQLAGNRGGQVVFSDFNVFLNIPDHYKNTPAIGAGGKYTGKTYSEYNNESRMFLKAICEVLMQGDANGGNFAFPKILLHITANDFEVEDEIFDLACQVNAKRGSVYILYDRGDSVKISQCCRLNLEIAAEDVEKYTMHPEELRFSAWQNITICLPHIAYQYKDLKDVYKEIDRLVDLCMKGHVNKRDYLYKLLDMKEKGCLAFLTKGMDGKAYLRKEDAKFLVGMLGLNEMVQILTGKQLHENHSAYMLGLNIIAYLYKSVEIHAKAYGLTVLLEETPAEGLSLRSALLDLNMFEDAKNYVKGDVSTGHVYYTNSVHLAYNANVDIATRIELQSKFTPMIKAGAIIHNWHGATEPDAKQLKNLYKSVLLYTNAVQTADSPDMTVCYVCNTMSKGLHTECPNCHSTEVYNETRITGYFSKISGWTASKLAELNDRVKVNFDMSQFDFDDTTEKILFFQKPNCEKCTTVKATLESYLNTMPNIQVVDTETHEGLALACMYDIKLLPAIVKVKGKNIVNNSKLEQKGSFLKWIKDNI